MLIYPNKKNNRPLWINHVFDQFLKDFKANRDPRVNLRAAIKDLEQGRVDPEQLKIKVKLAKDLFAYSMQLTIPTRKLECCLA